MWHEARKQERLIRGMIVDYRRRAERRQDFYEKIQADPTQFLQLHGRRCKIHLDPALAAAGDGSAIIVPWQGQQDNLIDRFDVRAHLDHIPTVEKLVEVESAEIAHEERQCNYERYRILAQNDFLNLPEEKFLNQLYLEEQFGANAQLEAERNAGKKKPQKSGAQIGYSYDDADSLTGPQPFSHLMNQPPIATTTSTSTAKGDKDGDTDSESDIDMDVSIDVTKLDTTQAHELNAFGRNYGMVSNDFYSYLTKDADEADAMRLAREEEQEKMLLSGRRSRRERRAQKERRIAFRPLSPPSYAAKDDAENKKEESESRSPSPTDPNTGKITYITSFGGEDELQPHTKISINIGKGGQTLGESCLSATTAQEQPTYAQKVKENLEKLKAQNMADKRSKRSERSRSRASRSRDRSRRRRSYTRSRSRSYERRRRYRSRDRSSRSRRYRRSKSRSKSRSRNTRRRRYSSSSSDQSKKRSRSRTKRSPYAIRSKTEKKALPTKPITTTSVTTVTSVQTAIETAPTITTSLTTVPSFLFPSTSRPITTAAATSSKTSTITPEIAIVQPPTPPLKRYYGRKLANESSSESDHSTEIDESNAGTSKWTAVDESKEVETTSPTRTSTSSFLGKQTGKNTTSIQAKNSSLSNTTETKGTPGSSRLNLRDRLKKKMQNLLNKQYKADKRAEIEKTKRDRLMQQEREDEMRELALRLRRRQRELRHKYGTPNSSKSSDSDRTDGGKSKSRQRSRSSNDSRSKSPDARAVTARRSRERREERNKHSPTQRRSSSRKRRSKSRCSSIGRRRQRESPRGYQREKSYEHSSSRSHRSSRFSRSDDYKRRSPSRGRDADNRERERERERRRSRRRDSSERSRVRRRDHEPAQRSRETSERHSTSTASSQPSRTTSGISNRNAVVISAPPKLKKLVDY